MSLSVSDFRAEQFFMQLLAAMQSGLIQDLGETFFPEDGPFARALFPKHMEAIGLTKLCKVLGVFGGNRTGKSILLAYIARCWLTGKYPKHWEGRVFDKPTNGWISCPSSALMVTGLQKYLLGTSGEGGMICKDDIVDLTWSQAPGMIGTAIIKHAPTGLFSTVNLKTYDMGWRRFQSATLDWVINDEEPPPKIYSETLTRTGTTKGIAVNGFTALDGMTPMVAHLLPELAGVPPEEVDAEERKAIKHVFIGWDDVPPSVLPMEERKRLAAGFLPHEREARMKGIPQIGSGLVYPIAQEMFTCEPFEIPEAWPRLAALDPGGSEGGNGKTAGLWGAFDPHNEVWYLYSEHYQSFAPIPVHVSAMTKRGRWIPFEIDPAGASVIDGKGVYREFVKAMQEINPGWPTHKADKRFTVGRLELMGELQSGGVKVFNTLRHFLSEHRQYVVDEYGNFKGDHHLWDCARYLIRGKHHAALRPSSNAGMKRIPEHRIF